SIVTPVTPTRMFEYDNPVGEAGAPSLLRHSPSPDVRSGDRSPLLPRANSASWASSPPLDGTNKKRLRTAARGVELPPPAPTSTRTLVQSSAAHRMRTGRAILSCALVRTR